jgi:hypothetical protein
MVEENQVLKEFTEKEYAYGWSIDIEADEQVDLENILNRINFPIFGRN